MGKMGKMGYAPASRFAICQWAIWAIWAMPQQIDLGLFGLFGLCPSKSIGARAAAPGAGFWGNMGYLGYALLVGAARVRCGRRHAL